MAILPVDRQNLFCGHDREDGLQLDFEYEDGLVFSNIVVKNRFEGYEDVVHGGIVMGILDTIMWYAIFMKTKRICMTRHIQMDFMKPVMCNTRYRAKGQYIGARDKDVFVSGWMEDENGETCAKLTGIFREAKDLPVAEFMSLFDFSRTSPEIKEFFLSLLDDEKEEEGRLKVKG